MCLIFSAVLLVSVLSFQTIRAEDCTSGEKVQNSKNCQFYWECLNGRLLRQSCGSGNVYSMRRESCVALHSRYDDCTKRDTTLARATDVTVEQMGFDATLARATDVTTSACSVGDAYRSPEDCRVYFECHYPKYVMKRCIGSQVFSTKLRKCVNPRSEYNDCQVPPYVETTTPHCTVGEMLPSPDDSCAYLLCDNRYQLQRKQCPSGQVFNPSKKQCVANYSAKDECSPTYMKTTTPQCTVGEMLPNPNNSCTYLLCNNRYQLQEKQCSSGQVFSSTKKQCVTKYNAKDECSPMTKPSHCTSGELLPKKDNCSFYFLCGYNNELQEKQCETGKVFSPARKQCVQKYSLQDDCSQVTKLSACTVGELLPKKDNCSSYLLCGYNNELQEKQCEAGKVFSPTRKQCVQKYSLQDDCSQGTKPSPCTSGELLPKKDNCSFYFLCGYNNELHEKQCETGKVFSPTRKQCVQKYSLQDDCSQGTKPSSCSQGELLPKKDNCSSYFLCDYNYELQEKQCETGKVFSPARKQCVQKYGVQDDCSQVTKPSPCTFGEFLPKKDNCSFYFLCGYNNELQEKQCETGKVFSPARKQCVQKYSLQDDCSQGTKPVPCTYGELLPKKDNCSSYFLCGYNNELQEKRCEMGKVFSPTRKQCVQKYGLQDDCTQVIKPIPCIPGEFLPKKDNCSSYFLCGYDYKLQEKQCMPGKVFSPSRKQCVQKNGLQDDCSQVTKPSPCTPDTLLPMKNDCSSYFFCDYNYELREKQCETGKVFSPTRKQCVQKYSIQDDCSPASTLCEPGKKYSDVTNCNVYYLCRFGVRVKKTCSSGHHYSVSLESCVIAYSNYDDCIVS